jgi:hypothetical protein
VDDEVQVLNGRKMVAEDEEGLLHSDPLFPVHGLEREDREPGLAAEELFDANSFRGRGLDNVVSSCWISDPNPPPPLDPAKCVEDQLAGIPVTQILDNDVNQDAD